MIWKMQNLLPIPETESKFLTQPTAKKVVGVNQKASFPVVNLVLLV
jgi:hypothetical protein